MAQAWLHAKLTLVLLVIGYQIWCHALMQALRDGRNRHSERWFRLFNEVPSLLLIAIVILRRGQARHRLGKLCTGVVS